MKKNGFDSDYPDFTWENLYIKKPDSVGWYVDHR
jgi:hypothetical protein